MKRDKIEFELAGITRTLKHDGLCYHAIVPNSNGNPRVLGYYGNVGDGVLAHVKYACIEGETTLEDKECISLLDYVDRLESLYANIKGTTQADIANVIITPHVNRERIAKTISDTIEDNAKRKVINEGISERFKKSKKTAELDPTPKVLPPIEDEDEDL